MEIHRDLETGSGGERPPSNMSSSSRSTPFENKDGDKPGTPNDLPPGSKAQSPPRGPPPARWIPRRPPQDIWPSGPGLQVIPWPGSPCWPPGPAPARPRSTRASGHDAHPGPRVPPRLNGISNGVNGPSSKPSYSASSGA